MLTKNKIICTECVRVVSAPHSDTTNLFNHLKNHHKPQFHLAKDMCPINTVSNEGFRKMVNTLDKRYVIPSRNYFSKQALPALYLNRWGEIQRDVTAVEYFATTTDLWSSRTMEPYKSLTSHYINGNFAMKSR